jgi:hypothetical protein
MFLNILEKISQEFSRVPFFWAAWKIHNFSQAAQTPQCEPFNIGLN